MEFPFSQHGCRSEHPPPPTFLLTLGTADLQMLSSASALSSFSVFSCLPLRRDVLIGKAAVLDFNLKNQGNQV